MSLIWKLTLVSGLVFSLMECSSPAPHVAGFDAAAWQQDARACAGVRPKLLPVLRAHQDQLYGLRPEAIQALLGRPEQVEISTQTEKIYFYFVEPGQQCPGGPARAARLSVRFDALGQASEVLIPATQP